MVETTASNLRATDKKSRLALPLALLLGLAGGGAAFWITYNNIVTLPSFLSKNDVVMPSYVPLPTLVANLSGSAAGRQLRFTAQIEVLAEDVEYVTAHVPKILDVINIYLRAVDPERLQARDALLDLRLQLHHRLGVTVGFDRMKDFLITEFIIN